MIKTYIECDLCYKQIKDDVRLPDKYMPAMLYYEGNYQEWPDADGAIKHICKDCCRILFAASAGLHLRFLNLDIEGLQNYTIS